MPNDFVKKRAKELEEMLKAAPTVVAIKFSKEPEGQVAGTLPVQDVPVGQLGEFPNSIKIVSRISMQQQWIPRGAKQFRDVITGETEEV